MIASARREAIRAVVQSHVERHPELVAPLTWPAFRRICSRESVTLAVRPHPVGAQLIPMLGAWTIVVNVNQPKREALVCGAHELGHLWLHHDPYFARHETSVYDRSPDWHDAVREAEADHLAELLVRGPTSSPPPFARRGRANSRRVDPDQLALGELSRPSKPNAQALSADVAKLRNSAISPNRDTRALDALPAEADRRAHERRIARRGAKKLTPRVVADRVTPDDERIEWGNGTRPTRYVEPDGHRWTIYNARIMIVNARARLELVRDFMDRRATHRIFIDSTGQRRVYRFVPRELRAYKCKHLDRQLAAAKQWPRRSDRETRTIVQACEKASLSSS